MDNSIDLKNIAQHVRETMADDPNFIEAHEDAIGQVEDANPTNMGAAAPVIQMSDDQPQTIQDGDAPIILGGASAKPVTPLKEALEPTPTPMTTGLSDEDLRAIIPDMEDKEFKAMLPGFRAKLNDYQKQLVMSGFTPDEAVEATKKHAEREGSKINADWMETHPKKVDVVIDKTQVDEVKFTPEEKQKLSITPSIRLVVVEDRELASLPVERMDIKHKVDYLNVMKSGLSKYSVPLPGTGDILSFRGAQIVELMPCVNYEDDTNLDIIQKKAEVVYDKFIGGTLLKKFNSEGNIIMSFDDFCNQIAYIDLDMCLYGVVCASNMEECESSATCNKCGHQWIYKYNTKQLLTQDGFSDFFKERANGILNARGNEAKMKEYNQYMHTNMRYRSPYTNNVYEIEVPSIAKVLRTGGGIGSEDRHDQFIASLAMYIHTLYIYDKDKGTYLPIESKDNELDLFLETIGLLPDKDLQMLQSEVINKMLYATSLTMDITCPKCGTHTKQPLTAGQLVFLRARDLYIAMQ